MGESALTEGFDPSDPVVEKGVYMEKAGVAPEAPELR
jgi:hypothetical protein